MSQHATAYVRRLEIADETARTVFLLLAERTTAQGDRHRPEEIPEIMGLELQDHDIPALAEQTGWSATCRTRMYSRPELEDALHQAGFTVVSFAGDFTDGPVRPENRTVVTAITRSTP